MSQKLRIAAFFGLVTTVLGIAPASAVADGLPVPFDGGNNVGIQSLDGGSRYATVATRDETVAVQTATGNGEILKTAVLRGTWGIPLVAYDGSPSGLSADGERLVLIVPRTTFPRARTTFALLDTDNMRVREEFTLEGDYSFDALSPDGSTMYLIHYPSHDPTVYDVLAYDLEKGRLNSEPIIDPNESGEDMYGLPVTRATSPDGRWAYTLYDGREHPFIHALDTERGGAICIDLESVDRVSAFRGFGLQLTPDGSTMTVVKGSEPLEVVDTRTFAVAPAPAPETPNPAGEPGATAGDEDDLGSFAWTLIGGGVALLALAGGLMVIWRRRRPVDEADLERLVGVDPSPREEREPERVG